MGEYSEIKAGLGSPEGNMLDTLGRVYQKFSMDAGLVRPSAIKHGVKVVEGGMFLEMEKGNYNARIFQGTMAEVEALKYIRSLTILCEDYRQSGEVVEKLGLEIGPARDAVFAMAGGAAQPDDERRQAMVDFVSAFHALNPGAEINLLVHNSVCGGANHFTKGEMGMLYEEDPTKEGQKMVGYAEEFAQLVVDSGVDAEKLKAYIVKVEGTEYKGIEPLDIANQK